MSKLLTIIIISIIAVIFLFFHFHTPAEPVNNTFNNIQLDGDLNAILNPIPTNKTYDGMITTGHYKGTATVKNLTGKFDITITNANFNGILNGQVNNKSIFKGKVKGTLNGHIQGTYKVKKETNYFFWGIALMTFLTPTIIVILYLKFKKEPDVDMDEKERIATDWLELNGKDIHYFFTSVTYPKNITTFFFRGKGNHCYSLQITQNNKTRNLKTYRSIDQMEKKIDTLEKLELMITDENHKIKKKRKGF